MKVLLSLLVCALMIGSAIAGEKPDEAQQAILQELKEIRKTLEGIRTDVSALRQQESDQPGRPEAGPGGFRSIGPNYKKLAAIKLPDHPTDDQVKAYVYEILDASRDQNTSSDMDPQVGMLMKVGHDQLRVLIDASIETASAHSLHLNSAINRLTTDDDKVLVLEVLPLNHQLAKTVLARGWEREARDTLLAELKNPPTYLPTEWIEAVANLNDPETYPLLKNFFIHGGNRWCTYDAIKDLPGIHIEDSVGEAWEKSKSGECGDVYMAKIAAGYGYEDALALLVDSLSDERYGQWSSNLLRPAIFKVIDFRGSNSEIADWFKANKGKLEFDAASGRFKVKP